METFEYTILENLLCYFINGEVDGLTDNEIELLSDFEKNIIGDGTHMAVEVLEGTENFSRCDILKVGGNTVDVNFHIYP